MLPNRLRAEVKGYSVRDFTVPANTRQRYRAPFFPDWWQVRALPTQAISGILKVYPSITQSMSPHRISGTGEAQFPGMPNENEIVLENTSALDVTLSICATLGYPPSVVVNPITTAKPLSADIQSQIKVESAAVVSPFSFAYPHIGRFALVLSGYVEYAAAATQRTISSVTLGGAAGSLLGSRSQTGNVPANYWAYMEARWIDQLANGNLPLVITFSGAPPPVAQANLYVMVLSYTDGIRTGNFGSASIAAAPWTISYNVIGQSDASIIFSMAQTFAASPGGLLTDTASSLIFDPIHVALAPNAVMEGLLYKAGKGSQAFSYALGGASGETLMSVAIEVLPA
jgi:hypothetical protein